MIRTIFYFISFLIISFSCETKVNKIHKQDDTLLATVGNKEIYLSEIAGLLGQDITPNDSMQILNGLVDNWITDQLMILEAEKNMPKDLNLDQLVENYRASLLLYNYETKVVEAFLDTLVTLDQKQKYYQDNKDEYLISDPILKYMVAKVPLKAKKMEEFKKFWKENKTEEVSLYCKNYSKYYESDTATWKLQGELLAILPESIFSASNLSQKGSYNKSDKEYEYFVKINDYVGKNEIPPFDYIDSRITKVILNERKEELLKKKKQQIFDKEGRSSKVKRYTNN